MKQLNNKKMEKNVNKESNCIMEIDSKKLLNVDLPDGMYVLQYEWFKYGRGRKDFRNTEKVLVKNKKINIDTLLYAADIYRKKSGLLDDLWIEDVTTYPNGCIGYLTGS
jgi:hypothetical protein